MNLRERAENLFYYNIFMAKPGSVVGCFSDTTEVRVRAMPWQRGPWQHGRCRVGTVTIAVETAHPIFCSFDQRATNSTFWACSSCTECLMPLAAEKKEMWRDLTALASREPGDGTAHRTVSCCPVLPYGLVVDLHADR